MTRRVSGERTLKIGSKTYTLRLSFTAIATIEDHFDCSIVDLLEGGNPKLSVISFIFAQMIGVDPDEAWKLQNQAGVGLVGEKVAEVLIATLNPEADGPGKTKAGAV